MGRIKLHIADEHVKLCISEDSIRLAVAEAKPVYIGGEPYTGEYEVTPEFERQTLGTRGKLMSNDVTVNAITVSRTSNDYGTTIYIGGLLNG